MSQKPTKKRPSSKKPAALTPEEQLTELKKQLDAAAAAHDDAGPSERQTAWDAYEAAWEAYKKVSPEEMAWDAFMNASPTGAIYVAAIPHPEAGLPVGMAAQSPQELQAMRAGVAMGRQHGRASRNNKARSRVEERRRLIHQYIDAGMTVPKEIYKALTRDHPELMQRNKKGTPNRNGEVFVSLRSLVLDYNLHRGARAELQF